MTKMRRKGTGSIELLPDGRFRPRLPGRGARLDPCATRDEAERLLAAALAEIQAGAAVDPHAMTLRAWGAAVLDQRERNGIRSVATDRSRWRTHIDPWPCAAWPLRALTREDVALWRDGMLAKRVAPGNGHAATRKPRTVSRITVQNTLNLLRVVLGEAVERGLLRENPARDVRLPRAKARAHEPWTYLTPDEQQRLVAPLPGVDHVDQLAARFAVLTGLRQGEQWALRLQDVHLDDDAPHVVVRFGAPNRPPKNGKIRVVPLLPEAVAVVRAALEETPRHLGKHRNEHGLLWPAERGGRRPVGKPTRSWTTMLAAAGIVPERRHDGRPVRWHDLRHTCASSLVAGWWGRRWSLDEVRALLGHSSPTVTARYAHMAESAIAAAAKATSTSADGPRNRPTEASSEQSAEGENINDSAAAPPRRLERPANGLGTHDKSPVTSRGYPHFWDDLGTVAPRARAALVALATGEPSAVRLATELLADIVALSSTTRRAAGGEGRG